MTKLLTLAALTFSLALPSFQTAHACGGYGAVDEDLLQIERVLRAKFPADPAMRFQSLRAVAFVDGDPSRRLVEVRYRDNYAVGLQQLRVELRDGGWVVAGAEAPRDVHDGGAFPYAPIQWTAASK